MSILSQRQRALGLALTLLNHALTLILYFVAFADVIEARQRRQGDRMNKVEKKWNREKSKWL